jgi:hypothetical protein
MSEGSPPSADWYEQTFKSELAGVEATEHARPISPAHRPDASGNSIVVPGLGLGFDLADELKELALLQENGLLSPSEFSQAKQKVIQDTTKIYSRGGIYEKDEDSATSMDADWYRRQLIAIYRKYNPPKLDDVDRLLETFEGREEELLCAATRKYMDSGKKPKKSLAASVMQALSPIVIEKVVDDPDESAEDDGVDEDGEAGDDDEEGVEEEDNEKDDNDNDDDADEEEEENCDGGVTTPPLPPPQPAPTDEDDEMMAQAREIQEWVRLDFENIIIKWKMKQEVDESEAAENVPGSESPKKARSLGGAVHHTLCTILILYSYWIRCQVQYIIHHTLCTILILYS